MKRLGNMIYLIKRQRLEHNRHFNLLKMRHRKEWKVIPIEVFYDMFEVPIPKDSESVELASEDENRLNIFFKEQEG